jgi:hypothetical protein
VRPLFTRVEFDWPVATKGYTLLRRDDVAGLRIVPMKGRIATTKPFHQFPALFKQFATFQPTPEGALKFANKFGLLLMGENELAKWLRCRMDFADLIAADLNEDTSRSETTLSALSRVNSILSTEITTEISSLGGVVVKPRSLLAAMAFQLGLWFGSKDRRTGQCVRCGATWIFGSGSGHRISRQYCSVSCQAAAAYERKKKQKRVDSS